MISPLQHCADFTGPPPALVSTVGTVRDGLFTRQCVAPLPTPTSCYAKLAGPLPLPDQTIIKKLRVPFPHSVTVSKAAFPLAMSLVGTSCALVYAGGNNCRIAVIRAATSIVTRSSELSKVKVCLIQQTVYFVYL